MFCPLKLGGPPAFFTVPSGVNLDPKLLIATANREVPKPVL